LNHNIDIHVFMVSHPLFLHVVCILYSQICASRGWYQEASDHDDHCWWWSICWQPYWGLSHIRAQQWVYSELRHCGFQQNLWVSTPFFALCKSFAPAFGTQQNRDLSLRKILLEDSLYSVLFSPGVQRFFQVQPQCKPCFVTIKT
jgi:hypothetical protein